MNKLREYKALKIAGYVSLPFYPLFCLFIMDYFNYYPYGKLEALRGFIEKHPLSFRFEIIVTAVIFVLLLLLCRRAFIACGVLGALSFISAYINFVKLAQNGDNFFPRDILLAGSMGELTSFIATPMPRWFWIGLIFMVIWVVALWVIKTEIPLKWYIRLPSAGVLIIAVLIMFSNSAKSEKIIGKFGMSFVDTALQNSNYRANGFVGAFTINVLSMNVDKPEGYSEKEIDELLSPYTGSKDAAQDCDVILVLSESFFDIRELPGIAFSQNPLANYDEIISRENCYSGKIYTTAMGGGTVRPEFDILTGLTTDYLPGGASPYEYVSGSFETYVTNYKSAGYRTLALHMYDKTFYSRNTAYPHLGFDGYYGLKDMTSLIDVEYKRGYATDESTLEAMKFLLDETGDGEPAFLFTITIQNHQPFLAIDESAVKIGVTADGLTQEAYTAVSTYTQGLYDADRMLKDLADYIDGRERPTLLVFYGDHLPTLGSGYAAYVQTGYFDPTDGLDSEEALTMYSTPFLMYANFDLEDGILSGRTGNEISSYNLMNAAAASAGTSATPYMELLREFYRIQPYFNVRLRIEETEEIKRYTDAMRIITYDRLIGKNYSSEN